ncbi:MAG: hypothetical protein ACLU4N_27090 [Butyricimonas faecihominis]
MRRSVCWKRNRRGEGHRLLEEARFVCETPQNGVLGLKQINLAYFTELEMVLFINTRDKNVLETIIVFLNGIN